jgi:hypothetical protein
VDRDQLLRALAWGRIGFGAVAVLMPGRAASFWVGGDGRRPSARVLARALGGRDLALGLGTLLALNRGAPTRPWAQAGVLADSGDALATLFGYRRLPKRRRFLTVLIAGSAAVAGLQPATEGE